MSDEAPARGRLFVVSGPDAPARIEVARALAARLDRSIVVECSDLDRCVVSDRQPRSGEPDSGEPGSPAPRTAASEQLTRMRRQLLSWSAALSVAETYQLEGFDAVVTDDLRGEHLEDFLDLASPETVLLVVLDGGDRETPRWGLWLDLPVGPVGDEADTILARLEEASVVTAEPNPSIG